MKDNKMIILFCIVAALFFFVLGQSYATEYHHAYIGQSSEPTKTESSGTASAIAAAQHNYYWGKSSLQGSAAIGLFDNKEAVSFGLAKKYKKTLINGSISKEGNQLGIGAGVNWIF